MSCSTKKADISYMDARWPRRRGKSAEWGAMAGMEGVMKTKVHLCTFGMTQITLAGPRFARKPAGFLTSSPAIATERDRQCDNSRQHVAQEGGDRTRRAQMYPDELCKPICRGLRKQREMDVAGFFQIGNTSGVDNEELTESIARSEEILAADGWTEAWDDVIGKAQGPEFARRARRAEIEYFQKMEVYTEVPIE